MSTSFISRVKKARKPVTETAVKKTPKPAKNSAALTACLAKINKKYGKAAVRTFLSPEQEKAVLKQLECVSLGFQALDDVLTGFTDDDGELITGTGRGVPTGRVIEIYGPESSGKTTLALQVIAAFQKAGKRCAFIDAEHALDVAYAKRLGVSMRDLLFSQPDSAEEALDIGINLTSSNAVQLVVVDSVAALVPIAEQKGGMDDKHMGLQARVMGQALRKITAPAAKNGVLVIFINQLRQKIGVFFGNPETTPGGNALKFFASLRLDVRKVKSLKKKDRDIGIRSRIKVVKSKVATPFRCCYVDISGGKGIVRAYRDDPKLAAG